MFCTKAKPYLSPEDVGFEDLDITVDSSTILGLPKLGFMTIPVTVIREKVIVGLINENSLKL